MHKTVSMILTLVMILSVLTITPITNVTTVYAAANTPRILTNPTIPSDEVVIYTHDVVADYGADNTGVNDCTAKFQAALDDAYNNGGGIVFTPAGRYRFTGHLSIQAGVTLLGEWQNPDTNPTAAGTILQPTETGTTPFITVVSESCVKKLSIWYPNQSYTSPIAYPTTIFCQYGNVGVEDVTCYNSYVGVTSGASAVGLNDGLEGNVTIKNVYGTFLNQGFYQTNIGNFCLMTDLHLSSKYWINSGLTGAPTTSTQQQTLKTYMQANLIGLKAFGCFTPTFIHLDATQYHKINVEDANIGIDFDVMWSDIVNVTMNNVKVGIDVNTERYGTAIVGGTISVLSGTGNCGIRYNDNGNGRWVCIQGVTIGGSPQYGIY